MSSTAENLSDPELLEAAWDLSELCDGDEERTPQAELDQVPPRAHADGHERELGPDDGKGYTEAARALDGQNASMVRINERGDVIVSVAVPVQRFRAVRGALMLSTQGADIDDMVDLARIIDPEMRPALYKRIADIALFLSGIFPDHLTVFAARHQSRFSAKRTLKDYEQQGGRFFRVAAQETDQMRWRPAMGALAERFTLARWALNTLSDRYLKTQRDHYFQPPTRET